MSDNVVEARRLFTVEVTYSVMGRGLILVPGIVPQGDERFRVGDPIMLKRPDGSSLTARIGGLDIFSGTRQQKDVVILLVELGKEEVPIDTEVWSISRDSRSPA